MFSLFPFPLSRQSGHASPGENQLGNRFIPSETQAAVNRNLPFAGPICWNCTAFEGNWMAKAAVSAEKRG
jgi:hypothetical protein